MTIDQKIRVLLLQIPDQSAKNAHEIVRMMRELMRSSPHLNILCSDRVLIKNVRQSDHVRILVSGEETKTHNRLVAKRKMTQSQRDELYKARLDLKIKIVNALGGQCQVCGYQKHKACLAFHHIDPKTKDSEVGKMLSKATRHYLTKDYKKMQVLIDEVKKCKVLCPTCHTELHYLEKHNTFILNHS